MIHLTQQGYFSERGDTGMLTLCICLDDRNGLQFNKRRQSRDIRVLEDMAASCSGELLIGPYSEKLVQEAGIPCRVTAETAVKEGLYFAEAIPSETLMAVTDTLVVYRWNRHYPADVRWEIPAGFTLAETSHFPGKSHEIITKEVYVK